MNSYFKSRIDVSQFGYQAAAEMHDTKEVCYRLLGLLEKLKLFKTESDQDSIDLYYEIKQKIDVFIDIYRELR